MLGQWMDILNSRTPTVGEYDALVALADHYPYSSAVQSLKARGARFVSAVNFDTIAIEAAIRANNRRVFHSFVFTDEAEAELAETHPPAEAFITTIPTPERISELDRLIVAEAISAGAALDLLQDLEPQTTPTTEPAPVLPDRMSFSAWMESLAEATEAQSHAEQKSVVVASPATLALIDHFIENEASIVPKRAAFFSPAKAAKNSLIDNENIVSETLAQIYTTQGNIKKAISTYEKLSLRHPEKSSYFAPLISKLKQQLK